MQNRRPTLVLLPNLLDEEEHQYQKYLPRLVEEKIQTLNGLFAESEKGGRRYLKRFPFPEGRCFRDVPILLLNEHTKDKELRGLFDPVLKGEIWGVVSDAGLPCLADPGAKLVHLARDLDVHVEVCSGPSSIFFALMLSGLSAQRFSFHGYLEREPDLVRKQIAILEKQSHLQKMTQVFIEAPYRCNPLFQALIETLDEKTELSVCMNLTAQDEWVMTKKVREWRRREKPDLHKKRVVFLFSSENSI